MNRLFLLLAAIVLGASACKTTEPIVPLPDFTVVNHTPVHTFSALDPFTDAHLIVTNNTDAPLNLTWNRRVNVLNLIWTSSICDNIQCWNPPVRSKEFTIAANDVDTVSVRINPNAYLATEMVVVEIFKTVDPTLISTDTVTLISQ